MTSNKTPSQVEKLQKENWQLTYRVDENLRADFTSEAQYVSYKQTEAAKERLQKTVREEELGTRRIDRQLTHVEGELKRLSKLLESLREHARKGSKRYRGALDEALSLLNVQGQADRRSTVDEEDQ